MKQLTKNMLMVAAFAAIFICFMTPENVRAGIFPKKFLKHGNSFVFEKNIESKTLTTAKWKHFLFGLEVIGSGINFHTDRNYQASQTENLKEIAISLVPKFSKDTILKMAANLIPDESFETVTLKVLPAHALKPDRLIYELTLSSGGYVWMDASRGNHIATVQEENNINQNIPWKVVSASKQGIISTKLPGKTPQDHPCNISNFFGEKSKVYDAAACLKLTQTSCQVLNWEKSPVLLNPDFCKGNVENDPSAIRANKNSEKFLDYFALAHGYHSYDSKGATITSVVHAGDQYMNASWSQKGQYIVYGDGDGKTFNDFTLGVDVAGHEMTHALIQYTAKLIAMGESGALNESLADYFGEQVEDVYDWNIGADLFIEKSGDGALRDLANPSRINGVGPDKKGVLAMMPYPASTKKNGAST